MEKGTAAWRETLKAGKFAIVGVANTLIDFGVFTVLTQLAKVDVYVAQPVGFVCGMLNSYIFNRKWTFQAQDRFFSPALVRFVVLNLMMLAVSTGLLYLMYDWLGLPELLAKAGATGCTMVLSFLVNRLWVFRGGK